MATSQPYLAFGDLLKRYRSAAGLTQEDLAERARLSVRGISDLERGVNRTPRRETILALAEALHLPATERGAFEAAGRGWSTTPPAIVSARSPALRREWRRPADQLPQLSGRTRELALIERLLSQDEPGLLMVAGEPGIGKSRLLREAITLGISHEFQVCSAGCQRRSGQSAYTPVVDALARHVARQPSDQQRADVQGCGWLTRLLPELTELGGALMPAWTLPPEQERRLMFAAVGRYLANIAQPGGTLLVLDDLQWAGPDALDLLMSLFDPATPLPLKIVSAYRSTEMTSKDPLARFMTDLSQAGLLKRIELAPLNQAEATDLVTRLMVGIRASNDIEEETGNAVIERVLQRGGGVPLFLVSSARMLAADPQATNDEALPWDLEETIRQRLVRLPPLAEEMLGVAAVFGRVVPWDVLVAVMGRPEREAHTALEELVRERLLIEQSKSDYQFAHDLFREVTLKQLGGPRQAALHREIAEALERNGRESQVEELAFHYSRSDRREKAVNYLEQVGDRAQAMYAYAAAERSYNELIALLGSLERSREVARIREKLGDIYLITARYSQALEHLEPALQAYQAARDIEGVGRTLTHLAWAYTLRGTPDEARARLRPLALEALAFPHTTASARATLYAGLAEMYFVWDQYSDQLEAATQAVAYARESANEAVLHEAEIHRATALLLLGHTQEACHALQAALATVEASGDHKNVFYALTWLSIAHETLGQFAEARRAIEHAQRLTEQVGDTTNIAFMAYRHGVNAYYTGDWTQAQNDFERALTIGRTVESFACAFAPIGLGRLNLARGDIPEAMKLLEEAIALGTQTANFQALRWAHEALAECHLQRGEPERALTLLTPFLDRDGQEESDVTALLPLVAWATLERGDEAQAAILTQQGRRRAEAQEHLLALVDMLHVAARVGLRRHEYHAVEEILTEALTLSQTMTYPYAEAKTLYLRGLARSAANPKAQALDDLTRARDILTSLGERLYALRVAEALVGLACGR